MILCKCWLKTLLESADLLAFVISSGGFWYVVIYALCLYELEHISCMRSADLQFVGALRCITRLNRYFAIKLWFFEEITFFLSNGNAPFMTPGMIQRKYLSFNSERIICPQNYHFHFILFLGKWEICGSLKRVSGWSYAHCEKC